MAAVAAAEAATSVRVRGEGAACCPLSAARDLACILERLHHFVRNISLRHALLPLREEARECRLACRYYGLLDSTLCGLSGSALLRGSPRCGLCGDALSLLVQRFGALPVVSLVAAAIAAALAQVGMPAAAPQLRRGNAPPGRLPVRAAFVVELPLDRVCTGASQGGLVAAEGDQGGRSEDDRGRCCSGSQAAHSRADQVLLRQLRALLQSLL
mmetsp:Transcript_39311/g.109318  ORF Transcript_39311/g.109318 Transcript_39311/m.109318 type:complete len:213 (+) Transcript_39311:241-879(+)